ncbi:helix-turn-helix domain-containing protein [Ruminococcus albus]|uniref:DNA-binding helix-turn-helix protein n=1 Tax=Ruminococcus albus 8 TaxID=246199 RepID=E9SA67_RUMAL|nr:helix-turn-helix domain-containing protein [Ruminococcus albus]EGC03831.1 DNA-binding helix-turn-helix protein [Ruminococcus albus 8]MCC3350455.1 helix-turn-helix domain-containing protein [Ruminococcus albus 8]
MYYRRLRDLREDHDLKQREVAEMLQTTQQVYSEYEKGIREIPLHRVITLAKYYGVSIDYIVGLTDVPEPRR